MPVKVTVESVLAGKDAFETAKRNAEELNRNLRGQFAERERIIKLQARLSQTTDRQQKAAIRAEIAERRRGLQLARLKDQEEKAVTRELKQQISSQQRLNRLTQRLNRDLDKQQKQRSLLSRAQTAVGGAGGALALGGVAIAGRAAFEFGRKSIELAQRQAAVEAQLEARLRSTGGAVGLTADELKNYAGELQKVTNISDENIIAAEAMLASFTNIGKETFPRATKTVLDMATAMNNGATPGAEQLKNQSVQLGKALNDPIAGLGALSRVGVTFTDQQKEQIKAMTEAGDVAGAQAAILTELEKEFGGSAEAARQADGGFQAAANSAGDLSEAIGRYLVPSTSSLAENMSTALDSLTEFIDTRREMAEAATEEGQGVGAISNALVKMGADVATAKDEQQDFNAVLNDGTEALMDNTDAANDNAAALEEAQKRLEKVNEIRRDFAGSLLDIEKKAQEDSTEQWQDYYGELDDEADKFKDRITDLEEKAGKDRVAIGKKLAKDLAKLDHDLNRDREKINADTQKKIKRLKEDAAREDKQERRKRQIDAAGDERLFQFELQQLAAEGEALQIQEALKRREIEKQINADKRQEDERSESDDLQTKIERLKQDAQDRLREEEAQARERRELLNEQAEEDKAALAEQLQEQKETEAENLKERLEALKDSNREKLDNIEDTRLKSIEKLGQELTQTKDLTTKELADLKPVAAKLGVDVGDAFAQGISEGYAQNRAIDELLAGLEGFTGSSSSGRRGGGSRGAAARQRALRHFQHGGDFMAHEPIRVGEAGPETVMFDRPGTVIPSGQAGGINITIPISSVGGVTEARVEAIARRHAQNLVNELENMIST